MNKGKVPHSTTFAGSVSMFAAVLGGGAATNCTVPTSGILTDAAAGLYPKGCNVAVSGTYVSTGIYTVVYSELVKHLIFATGIVVSDGGSPTAALHAVVTKITPASSTITVKVYTPAGTLTDLGTSDLLILRLDAADTTTVVAA